MRHPILVEEKTYDAVKKTHILKQIRNPGNTPIRERRGRKNSFYRGVMGENNKVRRESGGG